MTRPTVLAVAAGVTMLCSSFVFALSDASAGLADPFVDQAELLGPGQSGALSADGNTAIVGKLGDYAHVFTRSGSTWSQPVSLVPEIEGLDRVPDGFGEDVALSANGNTAIVGDAYGVARVFTREGATWHSTLIEAPPGEGDCSERFGNAVAISEDGNTMIIGDYFGCPEDLDGSAWIYSRSGHTWTVQAGPLHGEQKINPFGNDDSFGSTVALSGDGNTAIVGAEGEDKGFGAAWVYKRRGSTWSQDGPKLNPPGEPPDAHFGRAVALSGDGSRALIGTGTEANEGHSAWIFDRDPSGWTAQARLKSGEDSDVWGAFGWAVALSRSGNTALVGGPETGPDSEGEAWAFRSTGDNWIREPIQPPVPTQSGEFGVSVALAGDGATALVGALRGGAFVFSGPPDSEQPSATLPNPPGDGASAGSTTGVRSGGGGVLGGQTVFASSSQIRALLTGQLTPSGKTAKIATLLRSDGFAVRFRALEAGTAVIDWYEARAGAKLAKNAKYAKPKPVLIASGKRTFSGAGTATIKVKLTVAGRSVLKHASKLKLTAKGTFTPAGKTKVSATKVFELSSSRDEPLD